MSVRILMGLALAAALGIAGADTLGGPEAQLAASCALLAALPALAFALRSRRGTVLVCWGIAGALGGLVRASVPALPDRVVTCGSARDATGRVFGRYRARIDGPSTWIVRDGRPPHWRVAVALEDEMCGHVWLPRGGRAIASLREGPFVARGDLIELDLAVEPFTPPHNPTERDERGAAGLDALQWRVFVGSAHLRVAGPRPLLARWLGMVDRARHAARGVFEERLSGPSAAIAKGLVMGDRGGMTPLERDAWADAGVAHLLAVSGLHVTLVVVAVMALVRLLVGALGFVCDTLGERLSARVCGATVALPCAAWFCLWSGAPASALRATVMGAVVLAARSRGVQASSLAALGFAVFLMLVHTPLLLYDVGFGLSVVAVGALLVLPRVAWPLGAWGRRLGEGLLVSSAATLATAPLTAMAFGRVALVAPLSNIVAVPLGSAIATPLAFATLLTHELAPGLAAALARLTDWSLSALAKVVAVAAEVPVMVPPELSVLRLALYALSCVLAWRALRAGRLLALGLCVAGGLTCLTCTWPKSHQERLVVTFPYVGQGDAALLQLPDGTSMLVDTGGNVRPADWEPGRNVIAPLLRSKGIAALDFLVVTHAHPDHVGGLVYVAEHVPIHEVWHNGQNAEHPAFHGVRGRMRPPRTIQRGGVTIEVLHPVPRYYDELGSNDNSIVLLLRYGERTLLLTGDVEQLAEDEIPWPKAEVLKVPHHGSRTSSTAAMLDAVAPRLAVVSRGEHNAFGFPHPDVVARYRGRGVRWLDTAVHGAIELSTDGKCSWELTMQRRD